MANPVVNPIYAGSRQDYVKRVKDVVGRLKISIHQNIYDADFEYGKQPLRWEEYAVNGGAITHLPGVGGCQMYLPSGATNPSAITIRQSRPYHRYQPGKSMFMASAVNFGAPATAQFQRVGFFDDSNGVFFEQGSANANNSAGMYCVIRSDSNYHPASTPSAQAVLDVKFDFANWSDPQNIKTQINWNEIQMIWVEYAWYGAGTIRWGVLMNGEQYILHEVGTGNNPSYGGGNIGAAVSFTGTISASSNSLTVSSAAGLSNGMVVSGNSAIPAGTYITAISGTTVTLSAAATASLSSASLSAISAGAGAWSRTGNLPVRYEQRDSGVGAPATTFYHYGVSVIVEGRKDEQRGFTYSYGMNRNVPRRYVPPNQTQYPVLSIQGRVMGTQEVSQVGGPGDMLVNATSSSTNTLVFPTNQTASIGTVTKVFIQASAVTLNFRRGTNLPSTNGPALTLSGFTTTAAGVLNGTYTWSTSGAAGTYSVPSTGTVVVVPATLPTAVSVIGSVTTTSGNFAVNQWVGRSIYYLGQDSNYYTAKITANTATTITFQDIVSGGVMASAPAISGQQFIIGQINRGQFLPQSLLVSSDSNCIVELIASTPGNPVVLNGANFQALSTLGSPNSFATRDVSATSITANSGEVVYAFTTPAGGSGLLQIDLSNFFPLLNSIVGNAPDILTVAVSTRASQTPGIEISGATASGTTGTLYFVQPHGLNVGDLVTLSGFTPSAWNVNQAPVTAVPDAYKANITIPNGTNSATALGTSIFYNGANVGAHLICQEAMS